MNDFRFAGRSPWSHCLTSHRLTSHASGAIVRRCGVPIILLTLALLVFPRISRAADDGEAGKQLFEKRCTGCHALDRNKEGPRLAGVYGRPAGTAPNFNYSPALKSAHFVWDETQLDKWLTDTQALVEDNNMDFHVPKPDERAAIIHYLKLLSSPQKSASNFANR